MGLVDAYRKIIGKFNLGKDFVVFRPYMSCTAKNFPLKVIEKVAVMLLLSELPLIATALEFFFARVDRLTGTYFVSVWSMLMIKESGMLYLSTLDTISWVNSSCASLKAPSGISNLAVVPLLRTKPIRRNKLCAQEDDSRSICPTYPGLFSSTCSNRYRNNVTAIAWCNDIFLNHSVDLISK